jgi:Flp pilus assembly protein TadG
MKTKTHITRNEEGQAMVEFAMILPILITLVFGIIQFGILFNHSLTLTDAVRTGARQAAVSRTLPGDPVQAAKDRVKSAAAGSLTLTDSDITVTPKDLSGGGTFEQGGDVTVTATTPYTINIFGIPVKSGWLTSETTERVE